MFCPHCGSKIDDGVTFCPVCGQRVDGLGQKPSGPQTDPQTSQGAPVVPQGQVPSTNNPNDSGSFGWAVLGFFVPLVGLILYLVWKKEKPLTAKRAGKGALVGVIVNVLISVLIYATVGCAALTVASHTSSPTSQTETNASDSADDAATSDYADNFDTGSSDNGEIEFNVESDGSQRTATDSLYGYRLTLPGDFEFQGKSSAPEPFDGSEADFILTSSEQGGSDVFVYFAVCYNPDMMTAEEALDAFASSHGDTKTIPSSSSSDLLDFTYSDDYRKYDARLVAHEHSLAIVSVGMNKDTDEQTINQNASDIIQALNDDDVTD